MLALAEVDAATSDLDYVYRDRPAKVARVATEPR